MKYQIKDEKLLVIFMQLYFINNNIYENENWVTSLATPREQILRLWL